jgi:serine/threonine protein kinase
MATLEAESSLAMRLPVEEPQKKVSWTLAEGDEIVPGRTALRLLGGGERYEAYLAWDDRLLSLVVVKMLRPSLVHDGKARAALESEAAMLRRLQHPVVVREFDAVLAGERPHLVLEHVDGPRLSTLIRTSAIALEQTLSLGAQLSAAAHYLSVRNVVHLDIKPQNIIMAGPARLIDLSVAKRSADLATLASQVGTTRYMAPEQCDPARFGEIGPAADVWGIGVTLYWTLAGASPFPAPDDDPRAELHERYPQLAHAPTLLPRSAPPGLTDLVLATLAPRPAERPSAREVLAALEPQIAALPRPRLGRFRISSKKRPQI